MKVCKGKRPQSRQEFLRSAGAGGSARIASICLIYMQMMSKLLQQAILTLQVIPPLVLGIGSVVGKQGTLLDLALALSSLLWRRLRKARYDKISGGLPFDVSKTP
eukprot:gnl/TRDRNA2_/TRDRNA2_98532_c0_seq1.p2 gnl/TRDRNA2_/TRDRNA2_98532_c0~~gnl/TRDRNA2_/TRDRNA2_98532_c0_seq1.p2  ORF type:complete len:105 (-),score=11.99 gnl/TRDRNA2_/TRDRNA2_98532_c0_seq1:110-424(-)